MCLIQAGADSGDVANPCKTFAIVAWDITYVATFYSVLTEYIPSGSKELSIKTLRGPTLFKLHREHF